MDFFQRIAALELVGDLKLIITSTPVGQRVSVLLVNDKCGDDARKQIVPMNVAGTPQELDEGFFQAIAGRLQEASGLMVNMEAFQKGLEKAKLESAQQKQEADKVKKEKDEQKKAYETAMKKVDELEKEKKYREAYAKTPDPDLFPDQADTIRKKRAELLANFSQPGLFDPPASIQAQVETEVVSATETTEEVLTT